MLVFVCERNNELSNQPKRESNEEPTVLNWQTPCRTSAMSCSPLGYECIVIDCAHNITNKLFPSKFVFVSISKQNAEIEIPHMSFYNVRTLTGVSFGCSQIELFHDNLFAETGIRHVCIPDSVKEICMDCFGLCRNLSHVAFGRSPSLERIGIGSFACTSISEIFIPDSVRELHPGCFKHCRNLKRVNVSSDSLLEYIGLGAFADSSLVEFFIPPHLKRIGGAVFQGCAIQNVEISEQNSHFRLYGPTILSSSSSFVTFTSDVEEYFVRDDVVEIGDRCFYKSRSLLRVHFSESPAFVRLGSEAFCGSFIAEILVPDSVKVIAKGCFSMCQRLFRIVISQSSSLEEFEADACSHTWITEIYIPNSVRAIGDRCFSCCADLRTVILEPESSLERMGIEAFASSGIRDIFIPSAVQEVSDLCFYACRRLETIKFAEDEKRPTFGGKVFVGCEHLRNITFGNETVQTEE